MADLVETRAFRLTAADVALMKRCGRPRALNEGDVFFRNVGMAPRSYRLWESETDYVLVTRRVRRLFAAGLVSHRLSFHGGSAGGWVELTDAGIAAVTRFDASQTAVHVATDDTSTRSLRPLENVVDVLGDVDGVAQSDLVE